MPHSMNANWFIFFPKEVVSTSVKQFIDFLDDVGHAHKSISLFLDTFRASSISRYWFCWSKEVVLNRNESASFIEGGCWDI